MSDLLGFSTARRQSRAAVLAGWLDGGYVDIYDGDRPASADDAVTDQVLLATFEMPDPAGAAVAGVWTGDPLPDDALIVADGSAAWGRMRDAASVTICDADVGLVGSGAAIQVDSVVCAAGAYLIAASLQITEG